MSYINLLQIEKTEGLPPEVKKQLKLVLGVMRPRVQDMAFLLVIPPPPQALYDMLASFPSPKIRKRLKKEEEEEDDSIN